MPSHFVQRLKDFILLSCRFIFILGIKCFISFVACSEIVGARRWESAKTKIKREETGERKGGLPFSPSATFSQIMCACFSVHFTYASSHYVRGWNRLPHLRPWRRAASFPVVLGDLGCDVTFPACRENISLSSKPPLVTRIARTGQGVAGRRPFFARMHFKGLVSQNLSKCKQKVELKIVVANRPL